MAKTAKLLHRTRGRSVIGNVENVGKRLAEEKCFETLTEGRQRWRCL